MSSIEDWAEIRRLHWAEGIPIKEIACRLGVASMRAALSDRPPRYDSEPRRRVGERYEAEVRRLLDAYPRMPTTVIAEHIGWPHHVEVLTLTGDSYCARQRRQFLTKDNRSARA